MGPEIGNGISHIFEEIYKLSAALGTDYGSYGPYISNKKKSTQSDHRNRKLGSTE